MSIPEEITALSDEEITFITAAGDVSAVITKDGKIYTWGRTKVMILNTKILNREEVWEVNLL